jgi:Ran GTPase-activating protein (RanGAP) involved in mRNA processing and transport
MFPTNTFRLTYTAGGETHSEDNVRVDYLLQLFIRLRPLCLTMIKMSGTGFSPSDLSVFMSLLPGNLLHLDLSNLGLTTACVNALAKRLPRMRLQVFNISHNPIGDGSAWLLLEFIRQDTDLRALDLSYCVLTSGGLWPICNALSQRSLDLLDITGNDLRAEGAEHVRQLLQCSPRIREIRIDDARLSEGDVAMLVDAAQQCRFTELVSIVGSGAIAHREVPPFVRVDMQAPMREAAGLGRVLRRCEPPGAGD